MQSLKSSIERLAAQGEVEHNPEARPAFFEFRDALTQGKIRAAEKIVDSSDRSRWVVNIWVKHGILLGFRLGELTETGGGALGAEIGRPAAPCCEIASGRGRSPGSTFP